MAWPTATATVGMTTAATTIPEANRREVPKEEVSARESIQAPFRK